MSVKEVEKVVIKFAGDSGDGMQLVGSLFTNSVVNTGNELATFPDFPSEIRAPQGTVAGVSGFQIHFGSSGIHSPGDSPDVLIAMNPAALKANLHNLKDLATVVIDVDSFTKKNITKAGFENNPLEDESLSRFNIIQAPVTSLTQKSLEELELPRKSVDRCKNMLILGIVFWLYNKPLERTINFFNTKFVNKPSIAEANILALKAGFIYAENIEAITNSFSVSPSNKSQGIYRNVTGNQSTAWGLLAGAKKANKDLFLGTYPITPATDILHELTKHKWTGAKIFQAEDEIAGICSAIGASFAGDVAVTTTSGPGMALKTEAIGLAIMSELPLVIVNVQRGGPSTGLPTKTEQSDLLQAIYGRNGESPLVVLAASTPADCFFWAYEAIRIAVEHMTPVILLTESYIGNGAEPWKITKLEDLDPIHPNINLENNDNWAPYKRDADKLVRQWITPSTPDLQHRIGGLEKEDITGNVSYSSENHKKMTMIRQEKINKLANYIPEQRYKGKKASKLLVVSWGGQFGIVLGAVKNLQEQDEDIALINFNYINPLPKNTADIFAKFDNILVCELNLGQLATHLRNKLPQFKYLQCNKVEGLPFKIKELEIEFKKYL